MQFLHTRSCNYLILFTDRSHPSWARWQALDCSAFENFWPTHGPSYRRHCDVGKSPCRSKVAAFDVLQRHLGSAISRPSIVEPVDLARIALKRLGLVLAKIRATLVGRIGRHEWIPAPRRRMFRQSAKWAGTTGPSSIIPPQPVPVSHPVGFAVRPGRRRASKASSPQGH